MQGGVAARAQRDPARTAERPMYQPLYLCFGRYIVDRSPRGPRGDLSLMSWPSGGLFRNVGMFFVGI